MDHAEGDASVGRWDLGWDISAWPYAFWHRATCNSHGFACGVGSGDVMEDGTESDARPSASRTSNAAEMLLPQPPKQPCTLCDAGSADIGEGNAEADALGGAPITAENQDEASTSGSAVAKASGSQMRRVYAKPKPKHKASAFRMVALSDMDLKGAVPSAAAPCCICLPPALLDVCRLDLCHAAFVPVVVNLLP
jgi:hypothetical protein